MGFLAHIAGSVSKESLPYLCKRCYIFPTRRAGYQFGQLLQKQFPESSFIFPEITTIQDFIRRYADDAVADEFTLLTNLYPLHESLTNTGQPFDAFIPWGQQILKDFDEIDKYLVNAEQLFRSVSSQKQLEEDFALGEEARQYLSAFLDSLDDEKGGPYQQEFLKTWRVLGELYPLFRKSLQEKQLCYEGMAYREVYDKLIAGDLTLPWEQIHFCGFNAYSHCEEQIVLHITENFPAETWWDVSAEILDDPHHEAGNFIRRYRSMFSGERHHWITEGVPDPEKNIRITGIASQIGQAKYAAAEVASHEHENTCVVLCDEQLLVPLLDHLPAADFNITMGFPAKQTAAYLAVHQLLNLYRNAKVSTSSQVCYYKDVLALADNPFLAHYFKDIPALKDAISLSIPYVSLHTLQKFLRDPNQVYLFQSDEQATALLDKIISMLDSMSSTDPYFRLTRDLIRQTLQSMRQQIEESGIALSAPGLFRIVPAQLGSARIPFDSPADSPVQVMGFLETRLQDFDRVIILSLNDDILPGTNRTNTFIPYNIRRSFGLPTFEQFDGINAYHFYRLLKRAKHIDLVYNNAMSDNASEKSRFIRQLEFEWDGGHQHLHEQQLNADVRLLRQVPPRISIPKTTEMKAALQEMAFSPSSIKTYLNCPLQFYLKYLAKIEEPDELQADPDAAQFGNVLHHALDLFYQPLVGQMISRETIAANLRKKPFSEYLDEGAEKAGIPKSLFHGKNKLQWRVLERIGVLILENDSKVNAFTLLDTEKELRHDGLLLNNGSSCSIKGKIDRIDRLPDGRVRIIDYKTGKVELADLPKDDSEKELDNFFRKIFNETSKDHSISLQGMIYALLYERSNPGAEVVVGFYKATDLSSGIAYLNEGEPVPRFVLDAFGKRLSHLLSEIIYEKDSFDQSEDAGAYQYSPYAELLGF